jgi:hypothetical protein
LYEPQVNRTYAEMAAHYGTASTVRATIKRFQAAGLSWPLPEELTDAALAAKLFADAGTKQGHRRQIEPDEPYVFAEWRVRRVGIDYHVDVEGSSSRNGGRDHLGIVGG